MGGRAGTAVCNKRSEWQRKEEDKSTSPWLRRTKIATVSNRRTWKQVRVPARGTANQWDWVRKGRLKPSGTAGYGAVRRGATGGTDVLGGDLGVLGWPIVIRGVTRWGTVLSGGAPERVSTMLQSGLTEGCPRGTCVRG